MHALLHDERYLDLLIFWACKYFSNVILQVSPEDIDLKMPQQATGTGTTKLVSGRTADWAVDMRVVQHELIYSEGSNGHIMYIPLIK